MNPDQCLGLRPTAPPSTLPPVLRDRVVLQVGVSESVASLHNHAAYLFANNTGVQVYVFIKIWNQRVDSTRAVCVAVYRRGHLVPVQLMSIGDAAPKPQFMQFFRNQFPNQQLPDLENFNVVPTNDNANLFSVTILGAWILPEVTPALDDLIIDCSRMVGLIRYM